MAVGGRRVASWCWMGWHVGDGWIACSSEELGLPLAALTRELLSLFSSTTTTCAM
jgi:hypothetical protein